MIEWVKNNKLTAFLILVITGYLLSQIAPGPKLNYAVPGDGTSESGMKRAISSIAPVDDFAPQPNIPDRMVIEDSSLSLQVRDVEQTKNAITDYATSAGGYMVNSHISHPDEVANATVTVRVPSERFGETVDHFKEMAIKVVSESLNGRDVTDQYVDIEEQIETYEATKERYEAILENATEVEDITSLTREIVQVQQNIDSLKGQQQYLEQSADTAKISVYLSTDDLSLPYAPEDTFRPAVIFKLAVRSLVGFARNVAEFLIWVAVYSVVWVPIVIVIIFARKYLNRKNRSKK